HEDVTVHRVGIDPWIELNLEPRHPGIRVDKHAIDQRKLGEETRSHSITVTITVAITITIAIAVAIAITIAIAVAIAVAIAITAVGMAVAFSFTISPGGDAAEVGER